MSERDTQRADLHVETFGDGEPVFLLHSSGLSGRQWRRLANELAARGKRAVVPDFTGHGVSPPLEGGDPFSFREDVVALTALLERAGEPAHVVGHSYGALVGLLAALASPSRVRSLVLFEPVAFGALDSSDVDAREELSRVDMRWGTSAKEHERWLQGFVDYWGGSGAWLALREEARSEFRRVGWAVFEGVRTLAEDRTPASAYSAMPVPTRLITGERSPIAAGTVVRRLSEHLPHVSVVIVPNAGHMAPLSHADIVNRLVLESLDRPVSSLQ